MSKNAIILAAGMGNRFTDITSEVPKGFIRICDNTLIEMSIDKLLDHGYTKIIIVTGYMSEFYESLKTKYDCITTVHNKDYENSGSGYSLKLALDICEDDVTIIESDILYDESILAAVGDTTAIVTSGLTASGDEVFVEVKNGEMTNLSKSREQLTNSYNEFVGISFLSKDTIVKSIKPAMEIMFAEDKKFEYEHVYLNAIRNFSAKFKIARTDKIWCEIDNIVHYYRAVNKIYTKLNKC